ncbi:hypothetical protein MRB53_013655 [Persea americana]|uniref:Uncharacterized protein n=1 Tax=Persea americana TaxID=3435 RepID=A0ACC2K8L1_PERAE|nr:hypothetical protein MRB53_013655 [Persea americana]
MNLISYKNQQVEKSSLPEAQRHTAPTCVHLEEPTLMNLYYGYKALQVSPKTQMKVERLDQNKRTLLPHDTSIVEILGIVPSRFWDSDKLQLLCKQLDSLLKQPHGQSPMDIPAPQNQKSYAGFFSPTPISSPLVLPPPIWKDDKLTLKILHKMVNNNKESFSFSAIGKFVGRRPSLEVLEQWVLASWRLSMPCFISLIEKGHFLLRFNSLEDRDILVSQSPLLMDMKKLLLQSWSPGHLSGKFPFIVKPALLKTPPIALQLHPQIVSVTSTDIVPDESSLPV